MKTFFIFLISMFVMTSCQQNEEEIVNDGNKKASLLINEELKTLSSFNDSILQLRPQTRGFWGTLFATVSADIIGTKAGFEASVGVAAYITAATGGTAGPITGVAVLASSGLIGAGASYGAYKGCTLSCVPDDEFYDKLLNNMMSNQLSIARNVNLFKTRVKNLAEIDITNRILDKELCTITADLHNNIVNSTIECEKHPTTRNNVNTYIPVEPLKKSSYEIPLFTDYEVINMNTTTNNALKSYYNTHDYENTLSEMITKNLISIESGNILKLFLDALQSSNGDELNLDIIINTYSKVVSESNNIKVIDKNGLLVSFITAKNSINLWKEKITN